MRTPHGWVVPTSSSLVEDLAWSLLVLAGDEGLGQVSVRSLARHTHVSPGTISNHFTSKQEMLAICTSVIGRWLAQATSDHVDDRGAVGLFPSGDDDDRAYRLLVSGWAQLRAHALTDPAVDERVQGLTPLLRQCAAHACTDETPDLTWGAWLCVEGLRQELVRPQSSLDHDEALGLLQQIEPRATRGPRTYGE